MALADICKLNLQNKSYAFPNPIDIDGGFSSLRSDLDTSEHFAVPYNFDVSIELIKMYCTMSDNVCSRSPNFESLTLWSSLFNVFVFGLFLQINAINYMRT